MGCPLEREVDQICQGELGPPEVEVTPDEAPADYRGDLEVDQFGGSQLFTAKALSRLVAVPAVIGERDREHAGVNDEHARTAVCSQLL